VILQGSTAVPLAGLAHLCQFDPGHILGSHPAVGGMIDHDPVFGLPRINLRRHSRVADHLDLIHRTRFSERATGSIGQSAFWGIEQQ
jgi:hypothetical protein